MAPADLELILVPVDLDHVDCPARILLQVHALQDNIRRGVVLRTGEIDQMISLGLWSIWVLVDKGIWRMVRILASLQG